MNSLNGLNKKAWLSMGLCLSLAGVVQAGTTYDTGFESQESSGTLAGSSAGSSQGDAGTSTGTSGASQGTTGSMQGTQGMKIQSFQGLDKNSDSYVTKSELMDSPSLVKHFDKVDANKDGQLDENEYKNLIMENEQ